MKKEKGKIQGNEGKGESGGLWGASPWSPVVHWVGTPVVLMGGMNTLLVNDRRQSKE